MALGRLNINSVSEAELEAIPRIGPSLARKIADFRAGRGRIKNIDELLEVKGIGPKILAVIKPYLKIE